MFKFATDDFSRYACRKGDLTFEPAAQLSSQGKELLRVFQTLGVDRT